MKKLVILAALTMVAPAAMASKARVEALNNSRQIVDIQNAFDRPYQFMQLGSLATFEWGINGDGTLAVDPVTGKNAPTGRHAEGGFLNKEDDRAYGVYLGRRSADFSKVVNTVRGMAADSGDPGAAALQGMLLEQNGLNLFYASKMGDWTWGVTAKYSNGKKDGAIEYKSNSAGLSLGATNGQWEVELVQGITGKSELSGTVGVATTYEVESKGLTKLGVGYNVNESMQVYANYSMTKLEGTGTGAYDPAAGPLQQGLNATVENNKYSVGMINTVVKDDNMNFFYGVAYQNEEQKGIQDFKKSVLPVWLGVEANATSWMVFRGSIQQNIFINETEDTAATPTTKSDLDSIAFNAGVGIKLGNGMLDANFGTAKTGSLSFGDGSAPADEFLTNVAYTYNF